MKTIKRMFVILALSLAGITTAMAQYGPGSIAWDYQMAQRENAIRMQNNMMRAEILNHYRQQAAAATYHLMNNPFQPMQGVMTYDGVYVTPQNVNNYQKKSIDCEHCKDGYNYRTVYMGNGENRRIKSRCNFCHGKGTVTKTVRK